MVLRRLHSPSGPGSAVHVLEKLLLEDLPALPITLDLLPGTPYGRL